VEYISLSRDTTEADLKQRREIIDGTAHYIDQVRRPAIHRTTLLCVERKSRALYDDNKKLSLVRGLICWCFM